MIGIDYRRGAVWVWYRGPGAGGAADEVYVVEFTQRCDCDACAIPADA